MSKLSERRREIRGMDHGTAETELSDLRRRLFELRLQKQRGDVKNNRQFPQIRADIARLMHHIGELEHADVVATEAEMTADAAQPAPSAEAARPAEEE